MNDTRIAALLLAAGNASRYGSLKQLVTIDGEPMVHRAARTALAAGLDTCVVLGAEADAVQAALADLPLQCVRNESWADGMGGSIACGMRALLQHPTPPDAVLILLADQVLLGADELCALCAAHAAKPDAIIAADHGETAGPPCLFPARDFVALAALSGPVGARPLLHREAVRVRRLALPTARIDVDTPADLDALIARR